MFCLPAKCRSNLAARGLPLPLARRSAAWAEPATVSTQDSTNAVINANYSAFRTTRKSHFGPNSSADSAATWQVHAQAAAASDKPRNGDIINLGAKRRGKSGKR